MRNAVGREIPDEILRATGKEPFQGNNYKNGVPFRRQAPIIRPVMDNQHSPGQMQSAQRHDHQLPPSFP